MSQPMDMDPTALPFAAAWQGYAVVLERPRVIEGGEWAVAAVASGWQVELVGRGPRDWPSLACGLFGGEKGFDLQVHGDVEAGFHSISAFDGDRLTGALIVSHGSPDVACDWLVARLGTILDPTERFRLYSGRPGGAMAPRGATVCFCCDVRQNEIIAAIQTGAESVDLVGIATRAGTNCGRCRPAIAGLVEGWQSA